MLKVIINGVGAAALSNKPHVIWDMNLFGKVFDIETTVDNLPVIFALFIESNQK